MNGLLNKLKNNFPNQTVYVRDKEIILEWYTGSPSQSLVGSVVVDVQNGITKVDNVNNSTLVEILDIWWKWRWGWK